MIRKTFLAVVLLAIGAAGGFILYRSASAESPDRAVVGYLAAWQRGDYAAMKKLAAGAPEEFVAAHEMLIRDLKGTNFRVVPGRITETGGTATAVFTASLSLSGLGDWSYSGRLNLIRREQRWFIKWEPSTIHPSLRPGHRLARSRIWPERGAIVAHDDTPLLDVRSAVVVGAEPGRITDRNALVDAVATHLALDPAKVNSMLDAAGDRPDWLVPLAEIPVAQYEAVKPAIYPVPGLVFQRKALRIPPTPGFARHVLGSVGEATREVLDQFGPPYVAGDSIGLSGLERVYERRLSGAPSGDISIVGPAGEPIESLHRFPGKLSQPLKITLDLDVQNAAEAALEGVAQPAAIVVVDSATGQIRGSVSRPVAEFNRAFGGRYPPGSTFKIITAAAALSKGAAISDKIDCPPEAEVGGRTFRNFEGRGLGMTTLEEAFVQSCNTAFVKLAESLPGGALDETARWFGFENDYSVGLRTARATFPAPKDITERAAAAIGQARVQASPLQMASVAAAVSSGTWKAPRLIADAPAGKTAPAPDPAVVKTLQGLMTTVVERGTGVRAAVPGPPIAGKTGTAEFGKEVPPKTHAWFVGFRGTYAFAVLVEGGGVGGEVAAPIAAKLIAALPQP